MPPVTRGAALCIGRLSWPVGGQGIDAGASKKASTGARNGVLRGDDGGPGARGATMVSSLLQGAFEAM